MKIVIRFIGAALMAALLSDRASARQVSAPDGYWPTHGWHSATPEAEGMDSRVLAHALTFIRDKQIPIHSLTIVRNGRIVLDSYFYPFADGQLHDLASGTKSVTSTLVGIAIGQHKLSGVQQRVVPLLANAAIVPDTWKDRITIEHLLTMTSGFDCEWMEGEKTLDEMRSSANWVQFMLGRRMASAPGTEFAYCSPGMHLLSAVISRATGESAFDYARATLFKTLGIEQAAWPADAQGVSYGWGDLHLAPRDMAKIGYLWLQRGRWDDQQLVPADWVDAASQAHAEHMGKSYGYGLWVHPERDPPMFEADGRGGQIITVVPAKHLVVVMTGGGFDPGDIGKFILEAVKSDAPIAENAAAAAAELTASVAQAAAAPKPVAVQPMPGWALSVSGRRFVFDANPINLAALTVTFNQSSEAIARIEFADGRVEERPVGLDGVPRLSTGGRFGLPVAMQAMWMGSDALHLVYDEVGNINSLALHLSFRGDSVTAMVTERTGLIDHITIRGRATRK